MKKISLNLVSLITLIVACCCAYSLLLQDNFLHTSISSIILRTRHLELKQHLIVLGVLPIYIAAVIFGSTILGLYIGSSVKNFISRHLKNTA